MEYEDNKLLQQVENVLDKLTKDELILLNRAVVRRIRIMNDLQRLKEHAAFTPGDRVSWNDGRGNIRSGYVLRVNTKTISVEEEGDPEGIWRIPASMLQKLSD
jgi:hypothetical protein